MDHDLFVCSHKKWKELFPGQPMVKLLGAMRSNMGVPGVVRGPRTIPREWIFSYRCSWMAVYVFFRNAQSESHSDPHDLCMLSLFYQFPTIIYLPSMCYLSYGETPLVNCGPRSNFLYIAIPFYFSSHCLLSCILLSYCHSIHSILCLQQTGEIDNLIVSWE
jgi:hypothetical protein